MGRRSSIDTLPTEVRRWLERALTENNFSGYALTGSPAEGEGIRHHPLFPCSGSATKWSDNWPGIRAATEAARLMAQEAGDEADDRSAGMMAFIQTEMLDVLMRLQEIGESDDPAKRAKLLATCFGKYSHTGPCFGDPQAIPGRGAGKIEARMNALEKQAKSGDTA